MYSKLCALMTALTLFVLSGMPASAATTVDDVINKVRAPAYDCPDSALFDELETTLSDESITAEQRFSLLSAKGQFLICRGDYESALTMLKSLIAQEDVDDTSYAYVSAINQIGFIYDAQESPERCQYYRQARSLSSPERHSDIFTFASLSLITYCSESSTTGERLGKMFTVLEQNAASGNPGVLAHIHNAIGLLYGSLGQHALAAEQYIKAHEMGLKVYEGSNRLSILISAIVSLISSGQTEEAYRRIMEYGALNREINTPLTNYHYHYALSYYYRKTRDFDQLAATLPDFKTAISAVSSSFGLLMYNWHETEVCLYHHDLTCVQNYIDSLNKGDNYIPPRFRTNLDYLSFNLAMYLALGDIEKARIANEVFAAEAENKRIQQQNSANILSAANLYNRIYDLEGEVVEAKKERKQILAIVTGIFLITAALAAYVLRKKFLASKAIDPVTQLLNADTAISRINRLNAPGKNRAIAIAIFDISNLREIIRLLGSTKADSVLRKLAQTLQLTTRGNDILGRFGTEQFIMCLHNIEERSARSYFERVQTALDNTLDSGTKTGNVAVESSMSVFVSHEKITDLSDILDEMVMSIDMENR